MFWFCCFFIFTKPRYSSSFTQSLSDSDAEHIYFLSFGTVHSSKAQWILIHTIICLSLSVSSFAAPKIKTYCPLLNEVPPSEMFSTASEASQHTDSQSDATSESFSLRLTPSPIDDDDYETPDNSITNESGNDDDSMICHLVRTWPASRDF